MNTINTINNIQGKYKVLIVSSSHKNSNRKEGKSVFHNFCPGLPLSLALKSDLQILMLHSGPYLHT